MIKELYNLIGREPQLANPNKRGSPNCYLCLMNISMQKKFKKLLDYFQILMIKESCNLIRKEPQLADATKTKHFLMTISI